MCTRDGRLESKFLRQSKRSGDDALYTFLMAVSRGKPTIGRAFQKYCQRHSGVLEEPRSFTSPIFPHFDKKQATHYITDTYPNSFQSTLLRLQGIIGTWVICRL